MPALSFPNVPANDPPKRGKLAAPKQLFGPYNRYAVAPVFTRFEAVEWFVWDANVYADENGTPDVIRQAATLDEAVAGLVHKFDVGQVIWSKSGKRYTVIRLRSDNHPKLKGGLGYSVVGERDGRPFGPIRLMPESSFRVAP